MLKQVWARLRFGDVPSLVNIKIQLSWRTPLSFGKSIPRIYRRRNRVRQNLERDVSSPPFPIKPKRLNLKLPVKAIIEKIYILFALYFTIASEIPGIRIYIISMRPITFPVKFYKYQYSIFSRTLCLPSLFVSFMIFVL